MYVPLLIKSDYSLLKSLIKIKDLDKLSSFCALSLVDTNLFGSMEFYKFCLKKNIKPIIGLEIEINNYNLYLYAKNFSGYQNLITINSIKQNREVAVSDINLNNSNLKIVLPFNSRNLFSSLQGELYISYRNEYEKKNALLITDNIVFINEVLTFKEDDLKYLKYLYLIDNGKTINDAIDENSENYSLEYYKNISDDDKKSTLKFIEDINLQFDFTKRYIPIFDNNIDSKDYLLSLCKKGLYKRLNNNVNDIYLKRLKKELNVIIEMGFVDYFLIVYDYVLYAKSHDILVGPGRGSAAGSLVSYCLGITEIDPIKYNLVFERFLNKERVSMPDIDIDFEYLKRDEVVKYVQKRYGNDKVAAIITFNNLKEKQVIRDVGRILNVNQSIIDKFTKLFDSTGIKENLKKSNVINFIKMYKLEKLINISLKLEGLKRHISTHAAGIVISSENLEKIIPIAYNNDVKMTGFTMEYLEELGLLKMDFLALKNLTIIKNIINDIKRIDGKLINLNNIPLNDKETLKLFYYGNTLGIFQFEKKGMINFLMKLKCTSFKDLIAAVALYRPGPMENIDTFIKRKHKLTKITYFDELLKPILEETYGIIIYQEQIIEILRTYAGYSYAKADLIRKAISKKKIEIMNEEKENFIKSSIKNGHSKEDSEKLFDLILKFASYGFNKAHSVSYALIGYQMAYLKAHYTNIFFANLLNNVISSEIKTKEYLDEAKKMDITIKKPNINISTDKYICNEKELILPLSIIKNVGNEVINTILCEREKGIFSDFFNFVSRIYGKSVNKNIIELLILSGALDDFNYNKNTLLKNLDKAIMYTDIASGIDNSLIEKPYMEEFSEFSDSELMNYEKELFGFYISNHPVCKYNQPGIIKLINAKSYFDKQIKCIVIIESIKRIKTKKNEDMAFVKASDETSSFEFILFPKIYNNILNLEIGDICLIDGKVSKRISNYQIIVNKIVKK